MTADGRTRERLLLAHRSLRPVDPSGGAVTDLFVPAVIVHYFAATQTDVFSVAVAFDMPLAVAATSDPLRVPVR